MVYLYTCLCHYDYGIDGCPEFLPEGAMQFYFFDSNADCWISPDEMIDLIDHMEGALPGLNAALY